MQEIQKKLTVCYLNKERTRIIRFGKNDTTSFDFLGFTFYWSKKRRHAPALLKIKTRQKTLPRKIQEFHLWIKSVRSKLKLTEIWQLAILKLIGHYNDYGFADNLAKLSHFYQEAIRSMFK